MKLIIVSLMSVILAGCTTAINTKDVTKITVTETGLKIGQNVATQTYELVMGRSQVEYMKVPTGLNGTTNDDAQSAAIVPATVSSYEVNSHSAVFGNVAMTTTFGTGTNGVITTIGGQHPPINESTGTNNNLTPLSH